MKKLFVSCYLFLGLSGSVLAQSQDTLLIHAGTLLAIPGNPPEAEQSLVIRNGRIADIVDGYLDQDDLDGSVRLLDLSDQFVLPGLIDMHVHLLGDNSERSVTDPLLVTTSMSALKGARYANITLQSGFTTVRDLGGDPEAVFALRDAIQQGIIEGPTIFAAGSALAATGGHGDVDGVKAELLDLWTPDTICDGPYECRAAARAAIKYEANWIKITATGGVLSDTDTGLGQQMTDDELEEIVATAHGLGVKVAAHAHGADGINAALRAGVDSIDHGTFLDDESIRLFKQSGAYLVPTLMPGAKLPEAMVGNPIYSDVIRAKANAAAAAASENIGNAYRAGVNIAFGTDSAVTPHGRNAEEFALMVETGFSPSDAIVAATIGAANLLSQSDEIGTLEIGKQADIVATATSPLLDVTQLENITAVVVDGKVVK